MYRQQGDQQRPFSGGDPYAQQYPYGMPPMMMGMPPMSPYGVSPLYTRQWLWLTSSAGISRWIQPIRPTASYDGSSDGIPTSDDDGPTTRWRGRYSRPPRIASRGA